MDFKLENVLVSLLSLKTMGLGPFGASAPLFLRNGELLGHSPIRVQYPEFLELVNDYDILCFVETKTDDVDEIDLHGFYY